MSEASIRRAIRKYAKSYGLEIAFVTPDPHAPKRQPRPRLFSTYYYKTTDKGAGKWWRRGKACTRDSAIHAAIWKLLKKQCVHVDIYDQDNIRVAFMWTQNRGVRIVCV